ncbi:MAG: PQQ-binding-like beta-propeller repeat protein [Phycisphaerae bacterium]|nr:PQQ-binding-like beta-propeller repeat protein [Phycisphaerae bacterium]
MIRSCDGKEVRLCAVMGGMVTLLWLPTVSFAQPMRTGIEKPEVMAVAPGRIEEAPPILNLLQKADEAVAREDWKLAVDSLQRVIDDPGGAMLARKGGDGAGGQLYESARRTAIRAVSALPAEGLRTYRILLDGKAKGLYERAKSERDTDALREVVRRYLLTRWGDDAADTLASWALDEGRPVEAAIMLRSVFEFCQDRDVPEARLVGKLAAALAMMGLMTDATVEINNHRARLGDGGLFDKWLAKVPEAAYALRNGASCPEDVETIREGVSAESFHPTIEKGALWSARIDLAFGGDAGSADRGAWNLAFPGDSVEMQGDSIFVRTPTGCLAAEADDLRTLWQQPGELLGTTRQLQWDTRNQRFSHDLLFPRRMVIDDYIGASLAVIDDLVLTVERHRMNLADADLTPSMRGFNLGRTALRDEPLSRLYAYDVNDGKVRWVKGRGGAPDDPLTAADFRSVPIAVRGELWVPFYRQNDLYLGVLDPQDGRIRREMLLCSITGVWDVPGHEIRPAYADGIVFVPTGHGLLFAVDATEFTPLWAAGYLFHPAFRSAGRSDRDGQIISAPPAVAGGAVILATWEIPHLAAFDVTDGRLRWSKDLDGGSYLLDTDEERVWLGGAAIRAFRARDGAELWRFDVPDAAASGQAVLCGDVIFVLTMSGMITLDKNTGSVLERQQLPSGAPPLGQLLCRNGALYSYGEDGLRMFPDLAVRYAEARKHFEQRGDAESRFQLARIELFQGKPAEALEVLDDSAAMAEGGSLGENLRHVYVEAAVALALDDSTSVNRSIELLERARLKAERLDDRLRVGLGLTERQADMGRSLEAASGLWDMVVGPEGAALAETEPGVWQQGWLVVAPRIQALWSTLDSDARSNLAAVMSEGVTRWSSEALASDWSGAADRKLLAVAELGLDEGVSDRARLALADAALRRWRFEEAEQHLKCCARDCAMAPARNSARMRLAGLYADPALPSFDMASTELRELEAAAFDEPVPFEWLDIEGPAGPLASMTIGQWATSFREDGGLPPSGELPPAIESPAHVVLADQQRPAWSRPPTTAGSPPRVVRFPEDASAAPEDRVLLVASEGQVECKDALSGRDLWRAALTAPQSFPQPEINQAMFRPQPQFLPPIESAVDGQTAVTVVPGTGVFAIGTRSGKQLWYRPRPSVLVEENDEVACRPVADSGEVCLALDPHHATLVRASDGSIKWQTNVPGGNIGQLWLTSDRVIAADRMLEQITFLDRASGERRGTGRFVQPGSEAEPVRLVLSGDRFCGPEAGKSGDAVLGLDASTGDVVWRLAVTQPVVQIFEAAPGYLGVGLLGTEFLLVNAEDGELLRTLSVPGGRAVRDGLLVDGTLLLQQVVTRNSLRYSRICAVDLATGDAVWSRENLAPTAWPGRAFALADKSLFAVFSEASPIDPTTRRRAITNERLSLAVLDVASGQPIGPSLAIPDPAAAQRVAGDVLALRRAIIVGTNGGVYSFPTEWVEQDHTSLDGGP